MTFLSLVLICLTTARVTRLITTDVLLEGPRTWVVRKLLSPGHARKLRDKLAYLVMCDWCVSVYVGAAVVCAWVAWGDTMWLKAVMTVLSASLVTGLVASHVDRRD